MLIQDPEPYDITDFGIEPGEVERENGFAFVVLREPGATKFALVIEARGITPYDIEVIEDDYENEVVFTLVLSDFERNFV